MDVIAARATLGDEDDDVPVAVGRAVLELGRFERVERFERFERVRVDRVGSARTVVSLMTVVTVRGGAVVALAAAACVGLSRPATTMITATPAPRRSAAMSPARAMISPRWLRPPPSGCGCCTGTG